MGKSLYYDSSDGFRSLPITGGPERTPIDDRSDTVHLFQVDASHVCWLTSDQQLVRYLLAEGATSELIYLDTANNSNLGPFAMDAQWIYLCVGRQTLRVSKNPA